MAKPKDRYNYQSEKLHIARRVLMAPHPQGEARGFAAAFHEIDLAFHQFDMNRITDDNARGWIETIMRLKSTDGVSDPTGDGTYFHRARAMTVDERMEFSRAVDDLASWFDMQFWAD